MNEDYKSLVATYEGKVKFLSQHVVLSNQNKSAKKEQIESLRAELSQAAAPPHLMRSRA